jgi:hypothetical protein
MKNILYKILPVCLLTIGLTGCEDETKYRPLPEAVPLTMSINEKAFVMGEHLKVDIKVEPDADGNEVVANEDFDIYFTAKDILTAARISILLPTFRWMWKMSQSPISAKIQTAISWLFTVQDLPRMQRYL